MQLVVVVRLLLQLLLRLGRRMRLATLPEPSLLLLVLVMKQVPPPLALGSRQQPPRPNG